MSTPDELIFVYNADSGKWNGYLDMMHKVFSPKSYPCSLCAITYGVFSIRKEWAEFIESYPVPLRFLHKDEWEMEFQKEEPLPAVFRRSGDQLTLVIAPEKMNTFSLEELKDELIGFLGTEFEN